MPNDYFATVCCGLDNRGVAYANGKVFVGRLDAKLVALDANTGKELWTATVADYKKGHAITSPPLVYKNLVVTGIAGGEYGVRGFVAGLRSEHRQGGVEDLHHPGPGRARQRNLEGRFLEDRRRLDLVRRLLRSQAQPGVLVHQQRRTLGRPDPRQRLQRHRPVHQPVDLVAARVRRRHRQDRLGLPDARPPTCGTTTASTKACWPT